MAFTATTHWQAPFSQIVFHFSTKEQAGGRASPEPDANLKIYSLARRHFLKNLNLLREFTQLTLPPTPPFARMIRHRLLSVASCQGRRTVNRVQKVLPFARVLPYQASKRDHRLI
jgi:hypothetical protein